MVGIDGEFNGQFINYYNKFIFALETILVVDEGIDLSDYYPSVEWDILHVPAKRHEKR